ncbi:MAG: hypothetical protein HYZ46_05105 [Nitrosomonadales bacterium]|nr:hypothetical protein [Nitrosomonadales bacterium]
MFTDLVDLLLWRALATFLLVVSGAGAALALVLIFRPHWLEPINRIANRWISTRHLTQFLDRSFSIESWCYRYHRPLGIAVMLGAGYILGYFGLWFDRSAALQHWARLMHRALLEALLDAMVLSALAGAAVALAVGAFLWLRPSMLRDMEVQANRWVSSRRATKPLEIPRDQAERFVVQHAHRIGWLLLLASIYLFFIVFRLSL